MSLPQQAYIKNRRRFAAMVKDLAARTGAEPRIIEARARAIIGQITGGESSTKYLDARGWATLFEWFSAQLPPQTRQQPKNRRQYYPDALPTNKQKWIIGRMLDVLGWNEKTARNWMRKSFAFNFYKTRAEASDVIDGLKKVMIDQAKVLDKCAAIVAASLPKQPRELAWSVKHDIEHSRNYSKAKPGQVLTVIDIYNSHFQQGEP